MLAIIVQDTGRRFFQDLKDVLSDAVLCVLFPAGELIDAALQQPSVVPVFHFKIMTGGCLVVDAIAEIRECAGFSSAKCIGGVIIVANRCCEAGGCKHLPVHQSELSAVGLNESGNEQRIVDGVKNMEVQPGTAVMPVQMTRVNKGKTDQITGGKHDQVCFNSGLIGEMHRIAIEAGDVRLGRNVALADVIRQQCVNDRMCFKEAVIRLW